MFVVINKALRSTMPNALLLIALIILTPLNTAASGRNFAVPAIPVQLSVQSVNNQLEITSSDFHWIVHLDQTTVLGSKSTIQEALYDIPYFYSGNVIDHPNSWVRLNSKDKLFDADSKSLEDASIGGYVYLDGTLYKLSFETLAGHTLVPIDDSHPSATRLSPRNAINPLSIPSTSQATGGLALYKAIKIGIVIDSQYDEYYNGTGLTKALEIIHGVNGLFQDQLGLAVTVEDFKYFDNAETDPLRNFSDNMEVMLNEFRLSRMSNLELSSDLALVHLFTGNTNPNQPIGLSWIGTICQSDGYDVSVSTPFPYNMLLSAHEIAHNLGAVHDDEQRCLIDTSITGNEVMWSELSHNTTGTFSNCSIETMRTALSSSCVADNIDISMSIIATPTPNLFEQDVIISATNWDTTRPARQVTSITEFPDSIQFSSFSAGCSASGSTLTCEHGSVDVYSTTSTSATVLYANSEPSVISGKLAHEVFMDTNSNNNKAEVLIDFNTRTSSANALAASDDDENRSVTTGGSAGLGKFDLLSLLGLTLVIAPIASARTKQRI